MPEDSLRNIVKETSPELTDEQISRTIAFLKQREAEDPLALLQPMTLGEEGAQMMVVRNFNLEIALFLAQLTGSAIYTDAPTHWRQLHAQANSMPLRKVASSWSQLAERVHAITLPVDVRILVNLEMRVENKLSEIRAVFKKIAQSIRLHGAGAPRKCVKEQINDLHRVRKNLRREWSLIDPVPNSEMQFNGHIELSVPSAGFELQTVRRLLLTYGRVENVAGVSLALFVSASTGEGAVEPPGIGPNFVG